MNTTTTRTECPTCGRNIAVRNDGTLYAHGPRVNRCPAITDQKEDTVTEDPTFAGKTAQEWDAMALKSNQDAFDSFDRCDTDGALSQWASDQMATRYRSCAYVAENDGKMEIPALFLDSEQVTDARNVEGMYGWTWVHDDATGRPVWLSESKAQTAEKRRAYFMRKHDGYTVGWVTVEAGLNNNTGWPYPIRENVVNIITTDDTDFSEDHNSAY